MESFKQYRDQIEAEHARLEKLSPDKHIEKLEKTKSSIRAHAGRGAKYDQPRTQELIGRYNKHAEIMKDKHPKQWKEYCNKHNLDVSHKGGDMWA